MGPMHLGGRRHLSHVRAMVAAGDHVPAEADMLQPGPVTYTLVGRCRYCALRPDGRPRVTMGYQMLPEVWGLHVATPEHIRRMGDGRRERYEDAHPLGPDGGRQSLPGDEW